MDFDVLHSIPLVTRSLLLLSIASVMLVTFGVIHPVEILFSPLLVFQEKQYWRLITNFFYFGQLDLSSIFELHWLCIVSSSIEVQYFRRRKIDYCLTLLLAILSLLLFRIFRVVDTPYLSFSLCNALAYLFARLLPDLEVGIFFLITIPVRLLPIFFLVMALIFDRHRGIRLIMVEHLVGHILWYFLEIFPRITGWHLLRLQEHLMR
ncbi:hypothetical protein TraAM80_07898 [Trypanosoma rangeli]|uniref:Derlin n=1 Tax=Trypanosoma rangeli TaxID=5698 RepID=A0A422N3D3_TRYRA|nr:uncharacterized protein TraAM80_07898 [Trypanosoma rangeli]RNE99957.1 hypothetical protein TraAM80_07898 [Trypanosoma rangeli]|eukprot:RNE99957.1 hypothetical protein TraAM80_07898 [Trypanosoma rangeli]